MSSNPYHKNGALPFCKNFIVKQVYMSKTEIDVPRFQNLLMQVDAPFDISVWSGALERSGEIVGNYFRVINSLHQYKGLTWSDSDFGNTIITEIGHPEDELDEDGEPYEFLVTPDIRFFWGDNLALLEYEFLENKFNEYMSIYDSDSPAMTELLQQAAYESLEIRNKRRNKEDVSKNLKNLQDLLGSANIKPNQEIGANAPEQASFGTLIKKWENEKPIPEPLEEWKGSDFIAKYIRTWFFGHLAKMTGTQNPYQEEYDEEIAKYNVEAPKFDEGGE